MNTNKKARICNLIIVDESGSMSYLREATLSGINETISTIRRAQADFKDTQEHTLTLVTFDSNGRTPDVRTMIDNLPIDDVKEFQDYIPNGCTPLYDALGESLTALHKRIKDDKNASAVVTILTDGLENASQHWTARTVSQLIEQLKGEGWSFSYMGSAHDVKEVTDLLKIDNVVEFSHDQQGTSSIWGREQSAKRAYFEKMDRMYCDTAPLSDEELVSRKRQFASEYYGQRVSSDRISTLQPGEIFVFGSNAHGFHAGGAAAAAMARFGAVWGQGEGLQGRSYAIPTMEGIENLAGAVERFTQFAAAHPELRFLVTRIGCGIAGYAPSAVAPLFRDCIRLPNVALPAEFWKLLGVTNYNL